eukprot:SM000045S16244  [mRNA]  locus=s45:403433:406679:- [translate_table: standard]
MTTAARACGSASRSCGASTGPRAAAACRRRCTSSSTPPSPRSPSPPSPACTSARVPSDATISEAVVLLSENNVLSAPVRDVTASESASWTERYLGMVDFPAVVVWVLEQAELAAAALAAGTAAAAGVGAGALGALGAVTLGMTGPIAVAGLTVAAVGAAVAGGVAAERGVGQDPQHAADALGNDFYKVILREEPFKSTKVNNLVTQSSVIRGLAQCKGFAWFDSIASRAVEDLGLPVMAPAQVVAVEGDKLVLEAFILMREKEIGGIPVVDTHQKLIGNISTRDSRYLLLQPDLFARRKELTVMDFVKIVSSLPVDPSKDAMPPLLLPPITCLQTDTLADVIERLVTKNIHRVHVVRDDNSLIGVVTLRDIISCFVSEPQDYFQGFLGGCLNGADAKDKEA